MSKTNREKLSDVLWNAGIFDHEYGDTILALFDDEKKHHEAEVERVVEAERERIRKEMLRGKDFFDKVKETYPQYFI